MHSTGRATPPATPVVTIMPHARAAQAAPEPVIDADVPTVVRDLPKTTDPAPDALEATTAVREPPPEVVAKSKPSAADVAREASEAVAAKLRAKAAESIARVATGPIPRPESVPPPLQEPTPPPPPAVPEEPTVETRAPELPEPPVSEPAFEPERIPGSELVLPANPLMNLTDSSLQGFIDCTLYEETGNFFAAPDGGDGEQEGPRAPSLIGLENLEAISEPLVFDPPPGAHPEVTQGQIDSKPLRAPAGDDSDDVAVIVAPALPSVTLPAPPKSAALPALRAKLRRRWLPISAGAAVLGVIGGVLVVAGSSASSGDKPAPVHHAAAPPDAAAPVKPPAGSDDETVPPPPGSGPPAVGKGPCRVVVEATPAGSTVQVDGKPVGPSPIAIDGPCQKTQIEVVHARYVTAQKIVEPVAGTPEKVDVTLERPTHAVMVVTTPPGATISLDGRRAGVSPTVVQVIGFQAMRLTADKPGFTSKTVTLYSRVPRDRISVTLDRSLFPPKSKP
jgi:PEGA domain-containing protein